jgi:hypothetical protein
VLRVFVGYPASSGTYIQQSALPKHAMKTTYYIKLDVHTECVSIAYAIGGGRENATFVGECGGSNLSVERALRKLTAKSTG